MKLEAWAALAALGLSIMSAVLMVALYNFLIGPDHKGPSTQVLPGELVVQEISISAIPSTVVSFFVFAMGRGHGNKPAGLLLVGSGVIMILGMAFASTLVPQIQRQYATTGIIVIPYIFMAAGAATTGLGVYLAVVSKKRYAQNLDDLR